MEETDCNSMAQSHYFFLSQNPQQFSKDCNFLLSGIDTFKAVERLWDK